MTTADMPVAPRFNLLADLIGSFAFPNPDDDSEPHGPGAPHMRPAALAEIRRVTISLLAWAQLLGEQGTVTQPIAGTALQHGSSAPNPARPPAAPDKKKTHPDGDSQSDEGGETDRTKPVEPPAVVMAIITPSVERFVCDFSGEGSVALPVPSGPGANPWKLPIGSERLRTLGLLAAGAQFQFAAQATRLAALRTLFQWGARQLIEQGLRRLGHDSTALLRAAA